MNETLSAHGCLGRAGPRWVAEVGQRRCFDLIVYFDLFRGARSGLAQRTPGLRRYLGSLGPIEDGVVALGMEVAGQLRSKSVELIGAMKMLLAREHRIVAHRTHQMRPGHGIR